ncbi:TonB-dependent receptor [Pseudomaricurvus alkylphenolicus]|uniref:TonB-dependent receptor n=1 Tax=Pseudomaricurvus alkylphenolicus TaxID=1306991 RepID=UPI00142460CF|nr:TonB-dependent receptor [Pseudomaricurvus alkylphenolicus]NIB40482.1 TonB-dependent receptor [Pseudomaricurvus alkylphenolicus]
MRTTQLLPAVVMALSCTELVAEQAPMETMVVTATREGSLLKDIAGNTSLVTQDALKLVGHSHIQEALARVPGVNLARGNGQEYLPALRSPVLTGAGACGSILAAVDGIPLRSAGFCNINELFEAPSEQAQRIEVVRGPGSALYGSNAMTGVINVITPSVTEKSFWSLGLEAGPHDYSRLKYSQSERMGDHGLRADLVLAHDGGYRDDSGFDQQKLTLRHEYGTENLSYTTTLQASNLNQETAGYVNGTDAYKDSDLQDSNPNPEAYRDATALRLATQVVYTLDEQRRWVVTPYLRYTDMDFLQHFLPGDPLEENGQKSLGLQSAYFHNLNEKLKIIAGLDLEYTDGFLKQSQDAPTRGSAFLQATIPEGKHYDYQVDAIMAAPFVHANWDLSEKLSVQAGLRFEVMDYDYDNRMLDGRTAEDGTACGFGGCRYSRPADRDDRFENWSPKLGVLYRIDNDTQVYANVSQGFRAPQATELYRLQRAQQVADLDSESLDSLEIGLRGQQSLVAYEVIAYAMKKENVIFRDSDFFNVADGETRHLGLELALSYSINEQWDVALSASYAEHEYDDDRVLGGIAIDGNEVDSAPKHFGNLRLGWNPVANARAELEWVHQGDYYTDPENLHSYEGHDILNLRGTWQVNQSTRLTARATNLTDREYAERADYSGFSGDRYFPGEPRSLYVGVEFSY